MLITRRRLIPSRKAGIHEGYISILLDIYTNATAKIHIDKDVSKEVKIQRGVRQGDTISPNIFTAALEEVFKRSDLEQKGIDIDGEKLTDLQFSDDVAMVTTLVEAMEKQLTKLSRESKQVGILTMHKDKTKYMTNFDTNIDIVIANHKLEKVENYKYLGQTLRMKDTTREEIMSRIKAGWRSFGMYKDILTDNNIAMSLRRKVYNLCILTTMTYGAETWTTTNELNNELITTQRAMERKMVHLTIWDKINRELAVANCLPT